MKFSTKLFCILSTLALSVPAHATLSNAAQRLASDMGTQQAINATPSCDLTAMMGSNGGNLGTVNQLLCVVKGMGLTGPVEGTKAMSLGGQTMTIHYKLSVPGLTVDGVTYTHQIQLWTCGSSCTSASNFWPAIFATFSATSSKSVNKGILINNYGASSGTLKGTSFIRWDMGNVTAAKSIVLNMVDCSQSPTTAGYSVYRRNGNIATLDNILSNTSGAVERSGLAIDYTANSGNWYSDTTVSAGGDSPAWSGGFTRAATSTDWTYTAAATNNALTIDPFTTAISGATLSGASNQGVSCAGVTASGGVTSVNNGSNVLTTTITANGGMSLHPASL